MTKVREFDFKSGIVMSKRYLFSRWKNHTQSFKISSPLLFSNKKKKENLTTITGFCYCETTSSKRFSLKRLRCLQHMTSHKTRRFSKMSRRIPKGQRKSLFWCLVESSKLFMTHGWYTSCNKIHVEIIRQKFTFTTEN